MSNQDVPRPTLMQQIPEVIARERTFLIVLMCGFTGRGSHISHPFDGGLGGLRVCRATPRSRTTRSRRSARSSRPTASRRGGCCGCSWGASSSLTSTYSFITFDGDVSYQRLRLKGLRDGAHRVLVSPGRGAAVLVGADPVCGCRSARRSSCSPASRPTSRASERCSRRASRAMSSRSAWRSWSGMVTARMLERWMVGKAHLGVAHWAVDHLGACCGRFGFNRMRPTSRSTCPAKPQPARSF